MKIRRINYLIGYILILLMVEFSVKMGNHHLILPEFAVLCVGVLALQESHWIVNPFKIVLMPSITAILGFSINLLKIDYLFKIYLVILIMLVVLKIANSKLAPSFATGLLPIVTNTSHWYFILVVVGMTSILMLGVLLSGSYKNIQNPIKSLERDAMRQYLEILLLWIILVHLLGVDMMIAIPPVLVLLLEVIKKEHYPVNVFLKQVIIVTGIAYLSMGVHQLISNDVIYISMMMPLILIILKMFRIQLPAVYAFPLLILVIPTPMTQQLGLYTMFASGFSLGCVYILKKYSLKERIIQIVKMVIN